MKKKPTRFKLGDIVQIKSTAAAQDVLQAVWLNAASVIGLKAKITYLNDVTLGRAPRRYKCHRAVEIGTSRSLWLPPITLKKVKA